MNPMTKEEYEANPRAYWNGPRPEMEEIKKDMAGIPLLSSIPLWANYILPEILTNKDHGICLDLGCGGGRYILNTAAYFKKVLGVDFNAKSIEDAEDHAHSAHVENVEFCLADLGDIGIIPGESVDFAYSVAVFMHMPSETKLRAFKELHRVLKSQGSAALIEIVPMHEGAFDCPDIDEKEWEDMITETGLVIESTGPADPFMKFKLRRP